MRTLSRTSLVAATCAGILALAACTTSPQAATSAPATNTPNIPAAATEAPPVSEAATAEGQPIETAAIGCTKINLNSATESQLMETIPDFSSRMVREFQEYRPYASIQQFRREIGKYVDDATVAGYEQYVYVPVDVNESDAATLMQIAGVDETIAATLIAGRPFASIEAFTAALSAQVGAENTAQAACLLAAP